MGVAGLGGEVEHVSADAAILAQEVEVKAHDRDALRSPASRIRPPCRGCRAPPSRPGDSSPLRAAGTHDARLDDALNGLRHRRHQPVHRVFEVGAEDQPCLAFGEAQSYLAHSIVAPHQLMAQLVSIELKPLVKIRNWNSDCINPAKYSQTARRSPCPIAPFVANFSMRRVPQAVPFVTRSRDSASR